MSSSMKPLMASISTPSGTKSGQALELYNAHRSAIVQLLSYPTTAVADVIPQSVQGESFEIATEFGVPSRRSGHYV
jgi:hypothetical protein